MVQDSSLLEEAGANTLLNAYLETIDRSQFVLYCVRPTQIADMQEWCLSIATYHWNQSGTWRNRRRQGKSSLLHEHGVYFAQPPPIFPRRGIRAFNLLEDGPQVLRPSLRGNRSYLFAWPLWHR